MTEIWKPIAGYEGLYAVSNYGRVWSVLRPSTSNRTFGGYCLNPALRSGYPLVTLCRDGKRENRHVHQLVCEAFHGPCPGPGYMVAHRDGTRTNNRDTNLRWATARENCADKHLHGTTVRGEKVTGSKLTANQVAKMRHLYASGAYSYSTLAKMFGLNKSSVAQAITFKSWKHVDDSAAA